MVGLKIRWVSFLSVAGGGGGSGGGGGGMTCVVAVQGGTSIGSDGTQGKERIVGSDGHRVAFISSTVCCLGLFPHAARIGVRFLRQHCSKLFEVVPNLSGKEIV